MRVVIMLELTGEGAYEGLTASLVREGHAHLVGEEIEGEIGPYEGFIFEGSPRPYPEPIEATKE